MLLSIFLSLIPRLKPTFLKHATACTIFDIFLGLTGKSFFWGSLDNYIPTGKNMMELIYEIALMNIYTRLDNMSLLFCTLYMKYFIRIHPVACD